MSVVSAGRFSQDPAQGYPPGAAAAAVPSLHGQVHMLATYAAFLVRAAFGLVLAVRFAREPGWRPWAFLSAATSVVMIACIATFGAALGQGGPAGLFERMATAAPSIFTVLLAAQLLARGGRVAAE